MLGGEWNVHIAEGFYKAGMKLFPCSRKRVVDVLVAKGETSSLATAPALPGAALVIVSWMHLQKEIFYETLELNKIQNMFMETWRLSMMLCMWFQQLGRLGLGTRSLAGQCNIILKRKDNAMLVTLILILMATSCRSIDCKSGLYKIPWPPRWSSNQWLCDIQLHEMHQNYL